MCNLYGTVDRQTLRTRFFVDAGERTWDAQVAPLGDASGNVELAD